MTPQEAKQYLESKGIKTVPMPLNFDNMMPEQLVAAAEYVRAILNSKGETE